MVTELRCHLEPQRGRTPILSAREIEVPRQIANGFSTKEIAFTLGASAKTIETDPRNLMEKFAINNVAELTKYARREGLTTP